MQCKNIRKAAERTTCMLKRDRHLLKKIYELTVVYTFFSTKNVCEDRESRWGRQPDLTYTWYVWKSQADRKCRPHLINDTHSRPDSKPPRHC